MPGRSGGARPGAGRKPKPPEAPPAAGTSDPVTDPFDYLMSVVNDAGADARLRVRAAVAAVQYVRSKKGEGGKREDAEKRAQGAAAGRFAPKAPPKLVVSNK